MQGVVVDFQQELGISWPPASPATFLPSCYLDKSNLQLRLSVLEYCVVKMRHTQLPRKRSLPSLWPNPGRRLKTKQRNAQTPVTK